jgi:hypothetical protein
MTAMQTAKGSGTVSDVTKKDKKFRYQPAPETGPSRISRTQSLGRGI